MSHLHKEGVLVAVELEEVVVELGSDPLLVPAVEVPEEMVESLRAISGFRPYGGGRHVIFGLYGSCQPWVGIMGPEVHELEQWSST